MVLEHDEELMLGNCVKDAKERGFKVYITEEGILFRSCPQDRQSSSKMLKANILVHERLGEYRISADIRNLKNQNCCSWHTELTAENLETLFYSSMPHRLYGRIRKPTLP